MKSARRPMDGPPEDEVPSAVGRPEDPGSAEEDSFDTGLACLVGLLTADGDATETRTPLEAAGYTVRLCHFAVDHVGTTVEAADPVEQVTLRVQRLDPELPLPAYAHPLDAGLDLASAQSLTIAAGERVAVPTGLAIAVPKGWVGLVHPRSGLALREGLTVVNAPGTIDAGYRGEVHVLLVNLADAPVEIGRGDRVAQLLLQRVARVEVVEAQSLDDTSRGVGGFGSTGRATSDPS